MLLNCKNPIYNVVILLPEIKKVYLQMDSKGQIGVASGAIGIASILVLAIVVVISQIVVDNLLNATNLNTGLYTLLPTLWPVIVIMALVSAVVGVLGFFFISRR